MSSSIDSREVAAVGARGAPAPTWPRELGPQADRGAAVFVLGAWLLMTLWALAFVARYGVNLPYDGVTVPVLSGDEPLTAEWLWSQHNEHRLPVTKLLMWGLARLTESDFRAPLFVSVLLLSVATLILLATAARLRGRPDYADAFFPLALLHLGHYENLLWDIQLFFVSSVVLVLVFLAVVARPPPEWSRGAAIVLGSSVLLLTLHGAIGLAFVPPLAAWLLVAGVARTRARGRTGPGWLLVAAGLLTAAAVVIYFQNYERPLHHPPSPGIRQTLVVALQVLSMALGTAAVPLWPFSGLALIILLGSSAALPAWALLRTSRERLRAAGLLAVVAAVAALALAIGHGRAALGSGPGFSSRYALLSIGALCACYLAWGIYARPRPARFVQMCLFAGFCAFLTYSSLTAIGWARGRSAVVAAFAADVRAGLPDDLLAARHGMQLRQYAFLDLADLRRTATGPFEDAPPPLAVAGGIERALPLEIETANGMVCAATACRCTDQDPHVVVALREPISILALRVRFRLTNGSAASIPFQVFWRQAGENEFTEDERTVRPTLRSSSEPQEITVWIDETVDRIRFDPGPGPCLFELLSLRAGGESAPVADGAAVRHAPAAKRKAASPNGEGG
ncbi:MAG: hypothetical protein ABR599_00835 [Gemmatimonadota bacterium]